MSETQFQTSSLVAEVENNILAADVAAQFMILDSRWWTGGLCCTRSTSSGGGINKTLSLTMVSRLQVNNEYKIMDLVHIMTNFSQQNVILFIIR